MSIVETWTQNSQTGRPAIGRMVLATVIWSMAAALASWQAYEVAVNDLGVSRLSDPEPVRLLFIAASVFLFILFSTLSIGSLWQLSNFTRRSSLFIASRGELLRGNELQFAIRVATFKSLIEAISIDTPKEQLDDRFCQVGRQAGRSFAIRIAAIHDGIAPSGSPWASLRDVDRIRWWTDYDRTSGWGLISVIIRSSEIHVQIQHDLLFEHTEADPKSGEAIAFMLCGYCETVLNGILHDANVSIVPDQIQILSHRACYVFRSRTA